MQTQRIVDWLWEVICYHRYTSKSKGRENVMLTLFGGPFSYFIPWRPRPVRRHSHLMFHISRSCSQHILQRNLCSATNPESRIRIVCDVITFCARGFRQRQIRFVYWGLAVTSRDDVIDGRPPYWRYFFRAARVVLMEITLENGRNEIWKVFIYLHLDFLGK
jgi:hypothetical protein